jgi:hypothetical protein
VNAEIPDIQQTWEVWILAESARRTVMLAFLIYGVHSIFKHGVCLEIPTLGILPISTNAGVWESKATYLELLHQVATVKYDEFSSLWLASPPRKLEAFEKLPLVYCKGIDQVETRSYLNKID